MTDICIRSSAGAYSPPHARARACAVAAGLAGCYAHATPPAMIPTDYRKRHPIAIKEGERTVEVFVGTNRGGLNAGAARRRRRFRAGLEAAKSTGGIVIDVPAGTSNELAASGALREIRSILGAAGVPPACGERPAVSDRDSGQARAPSS